MYGNMYDLYVHIDVQHKTRLDNPPYNVTMLHKKGGKNMKKRFTIMLDEETLSILKKYRSKCCPIGFREHLEEELKAWAEWHLDHNEFPRTITELREEYKKLLHNEQK